MVDEATEEATYPHGRYSAIRLTALDVRLCAKSWGILGLGDRQRLSGESRFTFISERPEGSKAERVIVLELTGKQALRPDEIAREAIRRLILTDDPV
ncbi:hypothetical protein ASE85_00815 [Sphingobium sp. Leaf26]|nr:hypothetical protein ASE85_00815 [Sphingobium sp. Leaf26]